MIELKLNELRENVKSKISKETKKIMENSFDELRKKQILETSLKIGTKIPDFSLPNSDGKIITSEALLSKGTLIISFYRGSW